MIFLPGFNYSLWKYDYSGQSTKLLTLVEKVGNDIKIHYSTEFRISSKEKYLALIRGTLGRTDYGIVIKTLETLDDAFVLPISEIEKRSPDFVADISFENGGWTSDGRYFWADTHSGANVLGFIRIDTANWHFDLFLAPKDMLGGDALNLENGYVTVHPGNVWYGIAQVTDAEKARRRAQGIGTELYIQNLFTNDRQLVASTTEPLYFYKPQWLSDAVLQYTPPPAQRQPIQFRNDYRIQFRWQCHRERTTRPALTAIGKSAKM